MPKIQAQRRLPQKLFCQFLPRQHLQSKLLILQFQCPKSMVWQRILHLFLPWKSFYFYSHWQWGKSLTNRFLQGVRFHYLPKTAVYLQILHLLYSHNTSFLFLNQIFFFLLTAYVLTELYIKKEANTSKKESQISLELFCGAYGTRNRRSRFACKEPWPRLSRNLVWVILYLYNSFLGRNILYQVRFYP